MPAISFSTSGIQTLLYNLDPNKVQGPDRIVPFVLKNCAAEIAPILEIIFKQSLNSGVLPSDWLSANICPVFKKGNRDIPSNYRPISLTSSCCKIMEHVIFHSIMDHVQHHNILIDNQHGFRSGFSCQTQLISLIEDIYLMLWIVISDRCYTIGFSLTYISLTSSNIVKLIILLLCLGSNQISARSVLLWMVLILLKFHYQACLQGTVLGSLFFLLCINDIANGVSSSIRLFVDDCILHRIIKCDYSSSARSQFII